MTAIPLCAPTDTFFTVLPASFFFRELPVFFYDRLQIRLCRRYFSEIHWSALTVATFFPREFNIGGFLTSHAGNAADISEKKALLCCENAILQQQQCRFSKYKTTHWICRTMSSAGNKVHKKKETTVAMVDHWKLSAYGSSEARVTGFMTKKWPPLVPNRFSKHELHQNMISSKHKTWRFEIWKQTIIGQKASNRKLSVLQKQNTFAVEWVFFLLIQINSLIFNSFLVKLK